MHVTLFTPFSLGIGSVAGVLVGAAFWLAGAPSGLAILNGLVAGAFVFALLPLRRLKGRFPNGRTHGIWMVGYMVALAPGIFVRHAIAEPNPVVGLALSALFLLTGFAGLALGCLMATVERRDGVALTSAPGGPATSAE